MNKIVKLSAIALLATSTSLMAQTKSFEGAYIGAQIGFAGGELDGSSTSSSGATGSGSAGKVTAIGGFDLGYGFAAGKDFVFGVGATYIPVKAKLGGGSGTDASSGTSINVEVQDHYTLYIQPTFVINPSSALYLKAQYAHADLKTSNLTTASTDLEGWGGGIGLKTMLTPNAFIQVEANYTEYDRVSGTKTNSGGTSRASADPKVAAGLVTIGYKF
jgi:opacity protein-like surface antigen